VHALYKRIVPAIGTASLDAVALVPHRRGRTVPGGVVAIQIGFNFYYLPVALRRRLSAPCCSAPVARRHWEKRSSLSARLTIVGFPGLWFVPFRHRSRCCCSQADRAVDCVRRDETRARIALLSAAIASLGLALSAATVFSSSRASVYARTT